MPKVTEAHLEARRQQIIDAAWACFARKGYHQTTMQDICQKSVLSPGAIYRYFASKEAIRTAVWERHRVWARDVLKTARSQAQEPMDTMKVIGQTMWLSFFNDPAFETMARVEIENWPEILRNRDLLDDLRKDLTFWRALVTRVLSEAKEVGQLKADVEPASLASLFMCAHEGLRHFRLVDPDNFEPERVFEAMLALVHEDAPTKAGNAGPVSPADVPPLGTRLRQGRRGKKKEADDVRVRS
ncbi:MAG: TetR/AcrR family transcriptional regulator [Dehalococcoidia bacterium]